MKNDAPTFRVTMDKDMVMLCAMLEQIYPIDSSRSHLMLMTHALKPNAHGTIRKLLNKMDIFRFQQIDVQRPRKTGFLTEYQICDDLMQCASLNSLMAAHTRLNALSAIMQTGGFELTPAESMYIRVFHGAKQK